MSYLFESNESVSPRLSAADNATELLKLDGLAKEAVQEFESATRAVMDGNQASDSLERIHTLLTEFGTEDKGGLPEVSAKTLQVGIEHICTTVNYPVSKVGLPSLEEYVSTGTRVEATKQADVSIHALSQEIFAAIGLASGVLWRKMKVAVSHLLNRGEAWSKTASEMKETIEAAGGLTTLTAEDPTVKAGKSFTEGSSVVSQLKSLNTLVSKAEGISQKAEASIEFGTNPVAGHKWVMGVVSAMGAKKDAEATGGYETKEILSRVMSISVNDNFKEDGTGWLAKGKINKIKRTLPETMPALTPGEIDSILTACGEADFATAKSIDKAIGNVQAKVKVSFTAAKAVQGRKMPGDEDRIKLSVLKAIVRATTSLLTLISTSLLRWYGDAVKEAVKYVVASAKLYKKEAAVAAKLAKMTPTATDEENGEAGE